MLLNMFFLNHWYWVVRASVLRTLEQHEQAVAAYDKILELQPNSYWAWTYRGVSLKALNQEQEAISSFFKALEIHPNFSEAQDWLHLYLTGEARKAGVFQPTPQLEYALVLQKRAIEIDSSSVNWLNHAQLLEVMGQTEEALNSCQEAIQIAPEDKYAWHLSGTLLEELQRYEEALSCFDRALQIDPEDEYAWSYQSNLLEKLERHEEAIVSYQKTAQLLKKSTSRRVKIVPKDLKKFTEQNGYLEVGRLLEKAQHYEEAIAAYRRARNLKFPPDFMATNSWIHEANLLERLERYESLLTLCSEWLQAAQTDAEKYLPWRYQANTLKHLKEYEKALAAYDHYIEINSNQVEIWVDRGDILCELQRWQEALESYNQALSIDSTHKDAIAKREQVLKRGHN